ncbi:hypothetical protein AX14_004437 [Amanita brunnescens Koide BX004]|nr:hypothetical protein AX14_004437 [Amanita brunnescens Koide BX004]
MSSTWDINWDLNSSSRTTQQLYAGTTPFSANGVVEASDDSQNMTDLVAVNGHRNAWSSTSGLDLQLVDTWAANHSLAMENGVHTTVGTLGAPVFATQYQATMASTTTQVALLSSHTDTISSEPISPFIDMSTPAHTQAYAGTSPSTPTSFEASTTPTEPLSFFVSFSEGITHYHCDCGYETTRKADLRRHHESSKHSGQKYFCSFCGKGYSRTYNLEQHEKKHHS